MAQRHVKPVVPDSWPVVNPDTGRVCVKTQTLEDAVHRARRALGRAGGGVLVTQERDGMSQWTETVPPRSRAPRTAFRAASDVPG